VKFSALQQMPTTTMLTKARVLWWQDNANNMAGTIEDVVLLHNDKFAVCDSAKHNVNLLCTATNKIRKDAGNDKPGFKDGDNSTAEFNNPRGIAVMPDSNLIVADTGNHEIGEWKNEHGLTDATPSTQDSEDVTFRCPITHCVMVDPVVAGDNNTYERRAISRWFKRKKTYPLTNKEIKDDNSLRLLENKPLAQILRERRKKKTTDLQNVMKCTTTVQFLLRTERKCCPKKGQVLEYSST